MYFVALNAPLNRSVQRSNVGMSQDWVWLNSGS